MDAALLRAREPLQHFTLQASKSSIWSSSNSAAQELFASSVALPIAWLHLDANVERSRTRKHERVKESVCPCLCFPEQSILRKVATMLSSCCRRVLRAFAGCRKPSAAWSFKQVADGENVLSDSFQKHGSTSAEARLQTSGPLLSAVVLFCRRGVLPALTAASFLVWRL